MSKVNVVNVKGIKAKVSNSLTEVRSVLEKTKLPGTDIDVYTNHQATITAFNNMTATMGLFPMGYNDGQPNFIQFIMQSFLESPESSEMLQELSESNNTDKRSWIEIAEEKGFEKGREYILKEKFGLEIDESDIKYMEDVLIPQIFKVNQEVYYLHPRDVQTLADENETSFLSKISRISGGVNISRMSGGGGLLSTIYGCLVGMCGINAEKNAEEQRANDQSEEEDVLRREGPAGVRRLHKRRRAAKWGRALAIMQWLTTISVMIGVSYALYNWHLQNSTALDATLCTAVQSQRPVGWGYTISVMFGVDKAFYPDYVGTAECQRHSILVQAAKNNQLMAVLNLGGFVLSTIARMGGLISREQSNDFTSALATGISHVQRVVEPLDNVMLKRADMMVAHEKQSKEQLVSIGTEVKRQAAQLAEVGAAAGTLLVTGSPQAAMVVAKGVRTVTKGESVNEALGAYSKLYQPSSTAATYHGTSASVLSRPPENAVNESQQFFLQQRIMETVDKLHVETKKERKLALQETLNSLTRQLEDIQARKPVGASSATIPEESHESSIGASGLLRRRFKTGEGKGGAFCAQTAKGGKRKYNQKRTHRLRRA